MNEKRTFPIRDAVISDAIAVLEAAGLQPEVVESCSVPGCGECPEGHPIAA